MSNCGLTADFRINMQATSMSLLGLPCPKNHVRASAGPLTSLRSPTHHLRVSFSFLNSFVALPGGFVPTYTLQGDDSLSLTDHCDIPPSNCIPIKVDLAPQQYLVWSLICLKKVATILLRTLGRNRVSMDPYRKTP